MFAAACGAGRRHFNAVGHGIGSKLLRLVVERAGAEGVREIWGSVTADDIEANRAEGTIQLRRWFVGAEPTFRNARATMGPPQQAIERLLRKADRVIDESGCSCRASSRWG
jgi:hypothetical protein